MVQSTLTLAHNFYFCISSFKYKYFVYSAVRLFWWRKVWYPYIKNQTYGTVVPCKILLVRKWVTPVRPKLTVYELRAIPEGFTRKELFSNLTAYELPRVGVFKELLGVHIFNSYDFWAFWITNLRVWTSSNSSKLPDWNTNSHLIDLIDSLWLGAIKPWFSSSTIQWWLLLIA